jgi:hypothetical protein
MLLCSTLYTLVYLLHHLAATESPGSWKDLRTSINGLAKGSAENYLLPRSFDMGARGDFSYIQINDMVNVTVTGHGIVLDGLSKDRLFFVGGRLELDGLVLRNGNGVR